MDLQKIQSDIKTYLNYNSRIEGDSIIVPFGSSKNAASHAAKELRKALHGEYAIIRFSENSVECVRVKDHAPKGKKSK